MMSDIFHNSLIKPFHFLQGFKQHQLHDVLTDPGAADLTADVDFNYFRKIAGDTGNCQIVSPITL